MYANRLKAVLNAPERRLLTSLRTPGRIQDYLDELPINFEHGGETYMSVRRTIQSRTAHCFEGALVAAAALAYHGQKPLIMDLRATTHEDHVVTLFKVNDHWGAFSKTNHSTLRYRDPIYLSVRELAASYFHEYIEGDGSKIMREYSAPFDLSRYAPEKWVTAGEELFHIMEALDASRHFPLVPKKNMKLLRNASEIESDVLQITEWKEPRRKKSR